MNTPPEQSSGEPGAAEPDADASSPPREPPAKFRQLRRSGWRRAFVGALRGFQADNCVDLAAALTYWTILALFPAAIVVVSLVRLVATGQDALDAIMGMVGDLLPDEATGEVERHIREVVTQQSGAGLLLSFGLIGALWSASAYLRAFTRATNLIYGVEEGRPFYILLPQQLLLTVVAMLLAAAIAVGLLVSGPIAAALGRLAGFEETAAAVWDVAKLPVLIVLGGILLSLLYWLAPNVRQQGLRWVTAGGVLALLVWIAASVGFGIYVSQFGSYDTTYGSLGAIIVFLVWVFLTNCAVLLGVELNAELQRARRWQVDDEVDPQASPLPPKRSR